MTAVHVGHPRVFEPQAGSRATRASAPDTAAWEEHGWALSGWQTAATLGVIGLASALFALMG